MQFHYQTVVVDRIFPVSGPIQGNTTVAITGHGFTAPCISCYINKDLWCIFGHAARVPAYLDSANQISCVSPRSPTPGVVSVSIVNTDAVYLHKLAFRYESTLLALSLTPLIGPTRGGTTVVIDGKHFSMQVRGHGRTQNTGTAHLAHLHLHAQKLSPQFHVTHIDLRARRHPHSVALVINQLPEKWSLGVMTMVLEWNAQSPL